MRNSAIRWKLRSNEMGVSVSGENSPRLAILFDRVGPYHHARLEAASRIGSLHCVELSGIDSVYDWSHSHRARHYSSSLVFPSACVEAKSVGTIQNRLYAELDRIRPDVVAIPGWSSKAALTALKWCRLSNVPTILMADSWQGSKRRRFWMEWAKSQILTLYSAALVAGSRQQSYLESLGYDRESIFTGYDVVDNEYFAAGAAMSSGQARQLRSDWNLPKKFLLMVGRFVPEKNLFRLIEGFRRFLASSGDTSWHLVLVGGGPLENSLKHHARSLSDIDRISFRPFSQYDELPILYGLAEGLILASTSETWGLVVNEGMAAGLPVLVSEKCGCAPDLVRHGVNGLVFNPHDISAIADCISRLARSDEPLQGQRSREIIKEWSLSRFATGLWDAAKSALSQSMFTRSHRLASWLLDTTLWRQGLISSKPTLADTRTPLRSKQIAAAKTSAAME